MRTLNLALRPLLSILLLLLLPLYFGPTSPKVLSAIEPPYSAPLAAAFTPVLANRDITDSMRSEDGSDLVTMFLGELTMLGVWAWWGEGWSKSVRLTTSGFRILFHRELLEEE